METSERYVKSYWSQSITLNTSQHQNDVHVILFITQVEGCSIMSWDNAISYEVFERLT